MPKPVPVGPDDLLLVDCCQCGVELVGETHKLLAGAFAMPAVRGRVNGRPYCGPCLRRVTAQAALRFLDDTGKGSA